MSRPEPTSAMRTRRPPPPFRPVEVRRRHRRGPRLITVTLGGPALEGFEIEQPGASIRVLLPSPGDQSLTMPTWNGNEFLLADGRRPGIRTLTPRRFDAERRELDIEVVVHDRGLASDWAQSVAPGAPAAVSGPGRGYVVDRSCRTYLLGGDETAIPAISQLLEALPDESSVQVGIEIAHPDARLELPGHPRATVTWCERPGGDAARPDHPDQTPDNVRHSESPERRQPSATGDERYDAHPGHDAAIGVGLLAWIRETELSPDTRVWVAGEAAAVQRIRRHLFEERALPRSQATVRGYWKYGRSGEAGDDRP